MLRRRAHYPQSQPKFNLNIDSKTYGLLRMTEHDKIDNRLIVNAKSIYLRHSLDGIIFKQLQWLEISFPPLEPLWPICHGGSLDKPEKISLISEKICEFPAERSDLGADLVYFGVIYRTKVFIPTGPKSPSDCNAPGATPTQNLCRKNFSPGVQSRRPLL